MYFTIKRISLCFKECRIERMDSDTVVDHLQPGQSNLWEFYRRSPKKPPKNMQ
jgi:hypothetical protein